MKTLIISWVALTLSCASWAAPIIKTITSNDYKEAHAKTEYLKFIGSSTKFGFITTSFEGYAKNINISFDLDEKKGQVKTFIITIPNNALDTDNASRDSKLHEICLEESKFKTLRAELKGPISLGEVSDAKATVLFTPKDVTIEITLIYSLTKTNEGYKLDFKSSFPFKAVNIADPSIAIAKVAEEFQLEGSILITTGAI